MNDRKELKLGRLILERIEPDADFSERMGLARHGSRRYRPARLYDRPSVEERPDTACKREKVSTQLVLDLNEGGHQRDAHCEDQRRRAMTCGSSEMSSSSVRIARSTAATAFMIVV